MNLINLLHWIILGIPLILTYITIDNSFWVNIDKNKRLYQFYIICIILAFISGIALLIWTSLYKTKENDLVIIGILMLIGFSIIWVPMFRYNKIFTVISLIGAAIGSMILAHTVLAPIIYKTNDYSVLWAIPALFLVFQTTIMDLIVWNTYYFRSK